MLGLGMDPALREDQKIREGEGGGKRVNTPWDGNGKSKKRNIDVMRCDAVKVCCQLWLRLWIWILHLVMDCR
jgi:hypothetical protein